MRSTRGFGEIGSGATVALSTTIADINIEVITVTPNLLTTSSSRFNFTHLTLKVHAFLHLICIHIPASYQAMSVEKEKLKVHKLSLKGNLLPVRMSNSYVAV